MELAAADHPGFQSVKPAVVTTHSTADWAAQHLHVAGYTSSSFMGGAWARDDKGLLHVAKLRAEGNGADDEAGLVNVRLAWLERRTEACEALHRLLSVADKIDIDAAYRYAGSAAAWATLVHLFGESGDVVVRHQLEAAVMASAREFAHKTAEAEPIWPL